MNEARSEARALLERLAKHLRKYPTPIRPKWALQAADAIESYLVGRAKSLDKAFGLTPKLGPPTKDKEHEAIARQAIEMRFAGETWKDVVDALASQRCAVTDERTIRKLCKKWFPKIGAEMIGIDELIP